MLHPGFNVLLSGNEADNIIISLVRSRGLGFLDNERRMNVMLSRCRQSMLICSSRKYLSLPDVRGTLVGDVSGCQCTPIPLLISSLKLASRCEAANAEVSWVTMDMVQQWLW